MLEKPEEKSLKRAQRLESKDAMVATFSCGLLWTTSIFGCCAKNLALSVPTVSFGLAKEVACAYKLCLSYFE